MTDIAPAAAGPAAPAVRIEHLALWTRDLERMRAFYECYFGAVVGERYRSANRPGFVSYFVSFPGAVAITVGGMPLPRFPGGWFRLSFENQLGLAES